MDILQINSTKPIKNGRRKPYSRLNKIPLGINDIYTIDRYEDWLQFPAIRAWGRIYIKGFFCML